MKKTASCIGGNSCEYSFNSPNSRSNSVGKVKKNIPDNQITGFDINCSSLLRRVAGQNTQTHNTQASNTRILKKPNSEKSEAKIPKVRKRPKIELAILIEKINSVSDVSN